MSAGLFDKKEMLNMLKHLGDEFAGAKITQNKKKEEVKKTGQLMIDKEFILLKADLKHLTDDIYGIENKEENNGS